MGDWWNPWAWINRQAEEAEQRRQEAERLRQEEEERLRREEEERKRREEEERRRREEEERKRQEEERLRQEEAERQRLAAEEQKRQDDLAAQGQDVAHEMGIGATLAGSMSGFRQLEEKMAKAEEPSGADFRLLDEQSQRDQEAEEKRKQEEERTKVQEYLFAINVFGSVEDFKKSVIGRADEAVEWAKTKGKEIAQKMKEKELHEALMRDEDARDREGKEAREKQAEKEILEKYEDQFAEPERKSITLELLSQVWNPIKESISQAISESVKDLQKGQGFLEDRFVNKATIEDKEQLIKDMGLMTKPERMNRQTYLEQLERHNLLMPSQEEKLALLRELGNRQEREVDQLMGRITQLESQISNLEIRASIPGKNYLSPEVLEKKLTELENQLNPIKQDLIQKGYKAEAERASFMGRLTGAEMLAGGGFASATRNPLGGLGLVQSMQAVRWKESEFRKELRKENLSYGEQEIAANIYYLLEFTKAEGATNFVKRILPPPVQVGTKVVDDGINYLYDQIVVGAAESAMVDSEKEEARKRQLARKIAQYMIKIEKHKSDTKLRRIEEGEFGFD